MHDGPPRAASTPTIAAELLLSTALLFGAALLVAVSAALLVLPYAPSPGAATLFLAVLLVADLAILFLFLRSLLRRTVFGPLEEIGAHAERIASGDYGHRIPAAGRAELDLLVESVNTMARGLIRDRGLLEENVRSLESTNRELVETTDALIRTARMASVGTLAGGIAHEVGNPLGALRASLDMARRRAQKGGDVEEALELAREEAGRIDAIVQSILRFVRVDDDGGRSAAVAVAAAVRSAVELLERRGVLEGVDAVVRDGGGEAWVRAHRQLLEQVLVNLVMNAAQATKDQAGGERAQESRGRPAIEVEIRCERRALRATAARREGDPPGADYSHRRRFSRLREGTPAGHANRDEEVVIEVSDRGRGIPRGHLERIFDPFFTTRAPGEGTGMGLAITARIVSELGGELEAGNRPGGGAVLTVRLPRCDREEACVQASGRPSRQVERRTAAAKP